MPKSIPRSTRKHFQRGVKKALALERQTEREMFRNRKRRVQLQRTYASLLREVQSPKLGILSPGKLAWIAHRAIGLPRGVPESIGYQALKAHLSKRVLGKYVHGKQIARVIFGELGKEEEVAKQIAKTGKLQQAITECKSLEYELNMLVNKAENARLQGKTIAEPGSPEKSSGNFTRHMFATPVTLLVTKARFLQSELEERKKSKQQ